MSDIEDDDWDVDGQKCPVCQQYVVIPSGPKDSPILLVSDEPSTTEYGEGLPFIGQSAGVLRSEMGLFGMDLRAMRRMIMLPHPPAKGKNNKNRECLAHGIQEVVKEADGKKVVVLFGANTCKAFLNVTADEVSGLRMKSDFLRCIVLPCVSVGSVFNSGVGEIRFALRELKDLIQEFDLFPSNKKPGDKKSQSAKPIVDDVEDW